MADVDAGLIDGLTAEENQEFEAMRAATSDLAGESGSAPADGAGTPHADVGAQAPTDGAPADGSAAPAPGQQPAADDDDDDDTGQVQDGQQPANGRRRVSAKKYQRAEEARVAAEARAAELERNQARLDERLAILNEALTGQLPSQQQPGQAGHPGQPAAEDPEPDIEADIFAWAKWSQRQQARLRDEVSALRTGTEQRVQDSEVANTYVQDAQRFAAEEPAFVEAYQWLIGSRMAELAMYFFGKDLTDGKTQLTEDEVNRVAGTLAEEEKALVEGAIKGKQRPAQQVFKLARSRGWRPAPKAADVGQQPGQQQNGQPANGQQPAAGAPGSLAAPANGAQPSVTEEISRIKAGTEAARTLSSGGGAPATPLTAQRLASMSDDDFNAILERLSPDQERALFGA